MAKRVSNKEAARAKRAAMRRKRMSNPGGASKYARKKKWRDSNCGAPLPFFPDVMAMRIKPWGAEAWR